MASSTTRKESYHNNGNGSGIAEKFQTMASDTIEKLPETIRHYPLQSLAVGFGVGFLTAMLVKKII